LTLARENGNEVVTVRLSGESLCKAREKVVALQEKRGCPHSGEFKGLSPKGAVP
jgi:hypothetical protein